MNTTEILIRLLAALVVGIALGLNRDLHRKPAGVRTIGVVSLGAAMITLAPGLVPPGQLGSMGLSPIIQGILTGIGFLGAGMIVRSEKTSVIHGLTTAAIIWFAAGAGVIAALGAWTDLAIGTVLVFVLLMFGGPAERWFHRTFEPEAAAAPADKSRGPQVGETPS